MTGRSLIVVIKELLLLSAIFFIASNSVAQSSSRSSSVQKDDILRGFEITADLTEKDVVDIKNYGANLIRVMFADAKLITKTPPYTYNETEWKKLDYMIMYAKKYGLRVVIDPHTFPGFKSDYTTNAEDEFWKRPELQDKFVEMWKMISDRYKYNGDVIFGYDLLNEPAVKDAGVWNSLIKRLVKVIRDNGDNHPIIIEAFNLSQNNKYLARNETLHLLEIPKDSNIIFSTHFYEPHQYTHQLVSPAFEKMSYNESKINAKKIVQQEVERIRDFELKNPGLPIYIGEFSVSRIANDGNEYLKDLLDACEKYGWHWSYHAFRESFFWDAEMMDGTLEILPRSTTAPRIKLLQSYFKKNNFIKVTR